ncbi:hypothetical protein CSKR_103233 [Clonorchis sinensis]|uniref:C2H2-type domain-containing protein n=1 Tax=Clonorchis sinensis TaxID=79923 RepID=A0A419PCY2_CLOSI|nr:hypothetical protein CSKR_103233 [Clonorchis sinensis]
MTADQCRWSFCPFLPRLPERVSGGVGTPDLDASLGELRVQQLQTGLTTLFGFNVLVTFDNVHYKTSGASAPVPTSTQERLVGLTCEECGKWCKSKAGLVAHHRVHDNDSVGTNMVTQLACADCSRLFPTKIGLSQHRRHAHPTQHNADKLSRLLLDWGFLRSLSVTCVCSPLWVFCVRTILLCVAHGVEWIFLPLNLTPDPRSVFFYILRWSVYYPFTLTNSGVQFHGSLSYVDLGAVNFIHTVPSLFNREGIFQLHQN